MMTEDGTPTLAPLLEKRIAAVVQISIMPGTNARRSYGDPFFDRLLGRSNPAQERFSGSGVIVDASNGYVVTNHHVIEGASKVFVTLQDRRKFDALVVGSDQPTDVALKP